MNRFDEQICSVLVPIVNLESNYCSSFLHNLDLETIQYRNDERSEAVKILVAVIVWNVI